MNGDNEHTTTTDSLLFLHAIRGVLGRTPLWLLVSSVIFLLTLPVAIPRFNWFQPATSNRVEICFSALARPREQPPAFLTVRPWPLGLALSPLVPTYGSFRSSVSPLSCLAQIVPI